MKWAFITAIVNAAIFLWWLLGYADTIGTPHEFDYFWLSTVFLIVPVLIIVAHWLTRGRPKNEELWGGIGCSALILNFILFFGYLIRSGGGM